MDTGLDPGQGILHLAVGGGGDPVHVVALVGGHGLVDADHPTVAVSFAFFQSVDGDVAEIGDLGGFQVLVLGDLNIQDDGVVAASQGGIAVEVPQGVGHQLAGLLVQLDFLDQVGMGADDRRPPRFSA